MSFQVIRNLGEESSPVKEGTSDMKIISCKDFDGELSSTTGIYSKFAYIGKINQLSGEPENPTVRIVCDPECVTECINLYKKKDDRS